MTMQTSTIAPMKPESILVAAGFFLLLVVMCLLYAIWHWQIYGYAPGFFFGWGG